MKESISDFGLSDVPVGSQLWVFPFERALSGVELESLSVELKSVIERWKSHGAEVRGGFAVVDGQFLLVAGGSEGAMPSGCSIDGLFRSVTREAKKIEVPIADYSRVFYVEGENIRSASRQEFKELASEDTLVYDPAIQKVDAFRNGKFKLRAGDSWHKQLINAS